MEQEQPTNRNPSRLAAIPLAVACAAVPLGSLLARFTGPGHEVSAFLPWLLLAALGTVRAILFRRSGSRLRPKFFLELAMFAGLAWLIGVRHRDLLYQLSWLADLTPELAPAIMLGFCGLWAITFGLPDRADFQRYGAILGLLCIADLAVEGFIYRAAPPVRWIGDMDLLAGLLLACLCAGLKPGLPEGGRYEPDQGRTVYRALILAGIMATLSRTGLFGAGWIYLCFGRGSRLIRTAVALACFGLLGASFLLPMTPADLARYVDYWLWAKSLALFTADPLVLLTGLPADQALPFTFPPEMIPVWDRVMDSPALFGAHLPQVPSFWLRSVLGWGLLPPAAFLIGLFILLFRRLTRMGAGLAAAIFVQGMSTPLLYDPSTGAVVGLALLLALSAPEFGPQCDSDHATPPETGAEPEPATEADPAREWDLRPL
ncbi:hypothetical protein [Pseudodesulfovibrio indicus]|uniref:hypothetical protein n=1 Tax=Pseudodesulfovibrio indicus TaxID=1716143 RepID=UPI0029310BE4|nr:hypothetical protein [Pseudodesulfovibrio indicus]